MQYFNLESTYTVDTQSVHIQNSSTPHEDVHYGYWNENEI